MMSKKILALSLALVMVLAFCLSAVFTGGTAVDAETTSASATRIAKISARPLANKAQIEKYKAAVSDETDEAELPDSETVEDTARVMSRFVHGIMYRAFDNKVMRRLREELKKEKEAKEKKK